MVEFCGKTALITGAGSGIGEAIACEMARKGTNLVLTGLGLDSLNAVKVKCEELGVKALTYESNLADLATLDGLVDFINGQNISLDFFILNAGISQRAKALDTDFDVDKKIMDVNFFGSVYLIKKFREHLKAAKFTSIAVTVSISGLFGFPLRSAYCASKHALIGFFESLELENENLRVTFLIPGRINTQISKSALLGSGATYAKMDKGQASGMDVNQCARIAVRAIAKKRHKKLIGKMELLMVYIHKWLPCLFYKLATKISST